MQNERLTGFEMTTLLPEVQYASPVSKMILTSTLFKYHKRETLLLKQLSLFDKTGMTLTFQQVQSSFCVLQQLKRVFVAEFFQLMSLCQQTKIAKS